MELPYLSVILPAYREAERIVAILDIIVSYCRAAGFPFELIVVDDGSPDATAETVRRYQSEKASTVRLIVHEKNLGKGAAVRTGMEAATGTYALFADVDNATPFEEVAKLLAAVENGWDIAIGSRYVEGSTIGKRQTWMRRFMSRAGNRLFRIVLRLPFADTRCGFKLFSRKSREVVFPRQTLERWGFDTEILVIALRHHLKVAEVPVHWYDSQRSAVHPVRDALRSFGEIYTILRKTISGAYD